MLHRCGTRRRISETRPTYFDLTTIALLREALEDAWGSLRPSEREMMTRSLLAERILKAAAGGERERECLIEAALGVELAA